MESRKTQFPPAALDWMVPELGGRVLNLAGTAALPRTLAARGHRVFSVHREPATIEALAQGRVTAVSALPEALPFQPCTFRSVVCHQVFASFAPGLALSEIARVTEPGGTFCVSLLTRDDSVPWVRRLVERVRQLDAGAMAGRYGAEAIGAFTTSKYFPVVEHREFRVWVPVGAEELVTMVTRAVSRVDSGSVRALGDDVRALYAQSAPASGPRRLPYALHMWRAEVDHSELTATIEYHDSGIIIPI